MFISKMEINVEKYASALETIKLTIAIKYPNIQFYKNTVLDYKILTAVKNLNQ
jgi:hypothetical protein